MSLFQNSVVAKYLNAQNKNTILERWNAYKNHFLNATIQENIRNSKEEQYQGEFLIDLFVNVLGYTKNPTPNFNLTTELKNEKDSKKADGGIIIENKVVAVIELKGTNTTDLNKIEVQAFGYKNNQKDCVYVVTSNFEKLRFYIDNAIDHIEFNLFQLTQKEFELLYLCLAYENIAKRIPKTIKNESVTEEENITKYLYADYSDFKRELHQNLVQQNPEFDALELFQKSQKLLDRFLFIFFAEDRNLLPTNLIFRINKEWRQLQEMRLNISLYDRYKTYFSDLNHGAKVVLPAFSETTSTHKEEHQIFAYNGGLFKQDAILDHIKIDDELLFRHTQKLSKYDFQSEVDVNILGHIFENSLNELDEMKAQLEGTIVEKKSTKRKKDGVFYTPKYITKYIVENTIGKLCTEKKLDLLINDDDYYINKKITNKTKQFLVDKLTQYRNWLLKITIVDPACGSGAFLNEALNFLIAEHSYIDELQAKLFGDALILSDVEKSILENNLFGVDLNEESVEIAKLSLWLRTAQPNRKLNDLNNNIKCGNSLIDDETIAGDKAFNWQLEFPQIFEKGGFDVVIGNPPYGAKVSKNDKAFFNNKYSFINSKTNDTYLFFTIKMIEILQPNGILGEIIPNSWMLIDSAKSFRCHLLKYKIEELIDYGDGVFPDATVESMTIVLRNNYTDSKVSIKRFKKTLQISAAFVSKNVWKENENQTILLDVNDDIQSVLSRLKIDTVKFQELAEIIWGIKPYQVGHGVPKQTKEMLSARIYHSKIKIDESWKPLVIGSNVNRYFFDTTNIEFIKYGSNLMYASNNKKIISEKLLIRQTSDILRVTYDNDCFYPQNSILIITTKDNSIELKMLLCLLNSKLLNFFYLIKNPQLGKTFAEIKPAIIRELPIKKSSIAQQQPFIEKANLMLSLNKDLQEHSQKFQRTIQRKFFNNNDDKGVKPLTKKLQDWYMLSYADFIKELSKQKIKLTLSQEAEWEDYFTQEATKVLALKNEIEITDKTIDKMVYELYGLSDEEIAIVEKS